MDLKYEEGIQCLKQCWKERGHTITDEEKAVMKSFRGVFVSGKSEPYSHELALKWLSDNQLAWGEEKYQQYRKLLYELNDAISNGTIKEDYSYLPTVYDTLTSDLKNHLILYRNELLSRLQYRSSRDQLMKIQKRENKLITNEGLAAILAQPKDTKIGIRDKTIMVLLYESDVRVSELTGLRINDVDFKTLSIHIHGKGNKERSVAISEKTAAHLKRYMSIYHSDGNRPDDYLFYTVIKGKAGSVSTSTVERILQKYADEARNKCPDIPEHVYPHLFRAERATHLYRDGVDSIMISKILGHSSIETTKIYALPSMDQMREAMNKVDMPTDAAEKPLWEGDEDEMARLCGLK